jgi:2-amino-4-hydroxy-6-hydroxymethyldihydropteridine diphosphokinase
MAHAFIGVGSNIDPETHVKKALALLSSHVHILKISTFYRTEPEKHPEQAPYYNGVVEIETNLPPRLVKYEVLRMIEERLGRKREGDRFASRTIDLDLLLYDHLVVRTDELIIPDPEIVERPYLAIPLIELEPGMILPGSDKPLKSSFQRKPPEHLKPLKRFTEDLRKEIIHGEKYRKD